MYFLFNAMMMIIRSFGKIIATNTNISKNCSVKSCLLRTFATLRHNYIQQTNSILLRDAFIIIHTH